MAHTDTLNVPRFDGYFGALLQLHFTQELKHAVRAGTGVALELLIVNLQLLQSLGNPHGEVPNPLHKLGQNPVLELVLGVGVAAGEGHQGVVSELVVLRGASTGWSGGLFSTFPTCSGLT